MASRSSEFHTSLHRPRLIAGVEKGSFAALCLIGVFSFVAGAYWFLPIVALIYFMARWLSKKDPQFVALTLNYLNEHHVYDALPRPEDTKRRPKGWGQNTQR